jgi:predicted DNA-binding transcriptional regulator AlpA
MQKSKQSEKTGFTRLGGCTSRFAVSPATWWRLVKAGKAPPTIKISERTSVWRLCDLDELEQLFIDGKDWRDHVSAEPAQV